MVRPTSPPSRSRRLGTAAWVSTVFLLLVIAVCFLCLPWTIQAYDAQQPQAGNLPPVGQPMSESMRAEFDNLDPELRPSWLHRLLGTDRLGRSMLARCLHGGAISLGIGLAAALLTMFIGTAWGMIAGYAGGRVDSFMVRIVDILYGLPYILLVLLLVIAVEGMIDNYEAWALDRQKAVDALTNAEEPPSPALQQRRRDYAEAKAKWDEARQRADEAAARVDDLPPDSPQRREVAAEARQLRREAERLNPNPWLLRFVREHRWAINIGALLIAIGSISWLTLARVVRGQVLSIKAQPFIEAARATGAPTTWILLRHVLPNLVGPIIVYTTLTVPQAILQESFLSFLGIGVQLPLPSWGNLASEGLAELNPIQSHWWLIVWPCLLLGLTLLALNFVGDGLRDYFDPRSRNR